ncbi:hypothetical protein [Phytopseudomonas dryadis]|uniref:Uncharacterized protein n=1 Tax=Phytopseudomonas dryadis TaxID=2487520 RepID=A0A4Q9QV95_9GAMM|nr:hypothetical protein [Pseudomonas dryadis]TBU87654.1 hypothetical protein DNK44_19920 [Pseudomonas dryadis]
MRDVAVVLTLCAALGGCAGGGSARERACEVFSPAEIDLPTTREEQRIDGQSSGDPTPRDGERNC